MTDPALLVVIGASAGGVEALQRLVSQLPADLRAAILVVLHMHPTAHSMLAGILNRAGPLPVTPAVHGAPIESGHIYVCSPRCHLTVVGGRIGLDLGPPLYGHRPSIDLLFTTAAEEWPGEVIGVLMSGTMTDGVAGLHRLRRFGAVTVAQAPDDALFPDLARAAIASGAAQEVLPVPDIALMILTRAWLLHDDLMDRTVSQVIDDPGG